MNFVAIQKLIKHDLETVGLLNTSYDVAYKAVNHFAYLRVIKCVTINETNPQYLNGNDKYTYGFLSAEKLSEFAKVEEYALSENGVAQALGEGHECYGIQDGNTLASYGWYTNNPTNFSDELRLHFNSDYIYMYQGYTHHKYRGERLHAIGMTMALREYLARGFKGLVSYVDSTNFSSLKSVYRMGYKDFGTIYILKAFGAYLTHRNQSCEEYGFRIEKI